MSRHGIVSADADGVGEVLDSLLDPLRHPTVDEWRREVTRRLLYLLGADLMSFQLPYPGVELFHSETFDFSLVQTYTSHFLPELVRTKAYARRIEKIGVGNRAALWGRERKWLYGSSYYNDLIKPGRAFDPIWAAVPVKGQRLPAILLGHHATRRGPRFGQRGLDIMRILRPALAASVATLHNVHQHRTTLPRSLDSLAVATLVVDPRRRIVHQNPAASAVLAREGDDDTLRTAVVRLADDANRALHAPEVSTAFPAQRVVRTCRGTYRVSVTFTLSGGVGTRPAALVFLEDQQAGYPRQEEIVRRWGVTVRQAEVACLLARRKTNVEIARTLGVSEHTARHHVEAVMGRLGVHSRRRVAAKLGIDGLNGQVGRPSSP